MGPRSGRGYYHTGTDSFENPRIQFFSNGDSVDLEFGFGPFSSWAKARKDFIDMLDSDIENLRYLKRNVKQLKLRRKAAKNE